MMRQKLINKKTIWLVIFIALGIWIYDEEFYQPPETMVTSISSDGHYAVTSSDDKRLTLWDLQNHREKIISTNANI